MDHETRRHRIRGGVRAIPHGGMFDCLFKYLMAVYLSVCLYLMAVCLSVCT